MYITIPTISDQGKLLRIRETALHTLQSSSDSKELCHFILVLALGSPRAACISDRFDHLTENSNSAGTSKKSCR